MLTISTLSTRPPCQQPWQRFSRSLRYELLTVYAVPFHQWQVVQQRWFQASKLANEVHVWRSRALAYAFQWHASQDLLLENQSLRALLGMHQRLPYRSMVARVLWHVGDAPVEPQALINQGAKEGVKPGMAVLSEAGVLGQVLEVRAHAATVLPVTSNQSTVPVMDAGRRHHFLLKGAGTSRPGKLVDVADSEPLAAGDPLWTSGLGGVYPPHVLVAHVQSLAHQPSTPFASVKVSYAAPWQTTRYVLLVDVAQHLKRPVTSRGAA